jgi:hypothetical protein
LGLPGLTEDGAHVCGHSVEADAQDVGDVAIALAQG